MAKDKLRARLDALAGEIAKAKSEFERHERWSDGHRLSAGELKARHDYLKSELDGEIRDLEAHGERVSDLEVSVRKWLDSLILRSE